MYVQEKCVKCPQTNPLNVINNLPSAGHDGGGQGKNLHVQKYTQQRERLAEWYQNPVNENEGCNIGVGIPNA